MVLASNGTAEVRLRAGSLRLIAGPWTYAAVWLVHNSPSDTNDQSLTRGFAVGALRFDCESQVIGVWVQLLIEHIQNPRRMRVVGRTAGSAAVPSEAECCGRTGWT
jgi:hypothetical protein